MSKICMGCGFKFQSDDENKLGYIPFEKLITNEAKLCKRCFRLKNYGIDTKGDIPAIFYKKEVENIINKVELVLLVVDIFDFETSMNDEILDIVRDKNTILLINKTDLLPKNIVKNKLIEWIKDRFNEEEAGFNELSFVSAKSVEGINGIIKKIINYAENRNLKTINTAIIGVSNTGKSSILNKIKQNYGQKDEMLTSKYSGTTIKSLKTQIKTKGYTINIFDTPGLIPKGRILEMLDIETSLSFVPQNRLLEKRVNLKSGDVLVLSKYVSIHKMDEKLDKNGVEHSVSFDIYASPFVKIHKTNENKHFELLETDFYNINKNEKIYSEGDNEVIVTVKKDEEIAISGLGFLTVSNTTKLKIRYKKEIKIVIRPRMLFKK